jgi:hypothetical protein
VSGGKARFSYPLEPVAQTRKWALDALLLTLGDCNAVLAVSAAECDALRAKLAQAGSDWAALGGEAQGAPAQSFALAARYAHLCAQRLHAAELEMERLQRECDAVAAQVVAAQRAVDATEEHRGELRLAFLKNRQCTEFKIADDQWNVKQAGIKINDD